MLAINNDGDDEDDDDDDDDDEGMEGDADSSQLQLCTPKTNNKWGDRAFANVAPKLWNTLPLEIRQSSSVEIFKKKLKHHLFMS